MILRARDVYKEFLQPGAPLRVLRGLELEVSAGETVAILGASGSGKSTLLSLLAGLDNPTRGQIEVAGRSLAQLDEAELARFRARHLGIVFQQYHLLSGLTALENVSLPLDLIEATDAGRRALRALDDVGLSERVDHFPHELSGGEAQRVAIARALVVEPSLILADEPSGSLDARTGERVIDLLFELVTSQGATLLLVTHNEALAKRCHRQLVLRDGVLA